ncbi:porin family protein [Adhaeribacter aquaticus]|uniref:porin family protein n=1 Tax=Adhaeribacter aquaticus TaxID=299567 RepID=UPI00041C050A|nr:porin family protein [Adhaeribacter aquaticus]
MKRILLLTILLFCGFISFSQRRVTTTAPVNHNLEGEGSSAPRNAGFGIKGGLNFANIHGDHTGAYPELDGFTSFHFGTFAQFSLGSAFSLQPEVLYSQQGFKTNNMLNRLDYINVPLLLGFRVLDNITIQAGPQASLLLTAKQGSTEINKQPHYNSFDYGLAGGIEGRLAMFRLGARYNHSIGDVFKDGHRVGNTPVTNIRNNVFQVYLGLGFH